MRFVLGMMLLLALLWGCTEPKKRVNAPLEPAHVEMTYHADSSFTLDEKLLIAEAAENIKLDTRGMARIHIIFDLDFNDVMSLDRLRDENLLLRVSSESDIIRNMDLFKNAKVYAFTSLGNHTHIYYAWDRMKESRQMFIHVAMHEFLHGIGMNHFDDDKGDIMAPYNNYVTEMSTDDMRQFCRLWKCAK